MLRETIFIASLLSVLGATGAAYAQYDFGHVLSADQPTKISSHVYVIKGYPNIGIIVGTKATLVVDTGLGPKNGEIASQVAMRLSPKGQRLYLTTTHFHPEHVAGTAGFPAGFTVIRPRVQQAELEAEGQKMVQDFSVRSDLDSALLKDVKVGPANILFDSAYMLDLGGGVQAQLLWYGPAHTKGDEVIMVQPDSVLISGDVVQNKTRPGFTCSECTPRTWLGVLDHIALLKPKIVVPDHSPPGDGSLVQANRDFLADLQTRVAALKGEGKSLEDAKRILAAEFKEKYRDWDRMDRIQDDIERGYND